MFVSICVLACARYPSTDLPGVSIAARPAHLSACLLIVAISPAPEKLAPVTGAHQRRSSGEPADEGEGEVVRGGEIGGGEEVRRWEKGA